MVTTGPQMQPALRRCPNCNTPLSSDKLWELCPRCGSPCPPRTSSWRETVPNRIGRYELVGERREGGMGVVCQAVDHSVGRDVAIKLLKDEYLGNPELRKRFRQEAVRASELHHRNIVPIFEVSEQEGQPFIVMPWLPRCLAQSAGRYLGNPWAAARLLIPIADAVHFGHRHGIVHADLKPDNILLGDEDWPYVSDFGASQLIDPEHPTSSRKLAGTRGFMAPEQAGGSGGITIGIDVWGLGALLYSLVCGSPPFPSGSDEAAARTLREQPAKNPLDLVPGLDADFVAILRQCLKENPEERYASAHEFATDLESWLADDPVRARPRSGAAHAITFARQHVWLTGMLVAAGCFVIALLAFSTLETPALEQKLREEMLAANQWAARAHAVAVQARLKELSGSVERAALDAEAAGDNASDRWRAIERALGGENQRKFDSFLQLESTGRIYARSPAAPQRLVDSLHGRAYFACAQQRAKLGDRRACVTGAYRSQIDGAFRFAIAAFLRVPNQATPEVVVATLSTDSVLGPLLLKQPHGARGDAGVLKVSLAARRDEGPSATPSFEWLLLEHETLGAGATKPVRSPVLDAIAHGRPSSERDGAYVDPLLPGAWLAGFAPVETAPWAVIVQSRDDAALAPRRKLTERTLFAATLATALGLLLVAGIQISAHQRRLRRPLATRARGTPAPS